MYRQGDVLLKIISEMPQGVQSSGKILVESQFSQHAHLVQNCKVFELDGKKYLTPFQGAVINHKTKGGGEADHAPITLPQDEIYEVVVQKQYDYFLKKEVPVFD